MPAPQEQSQPQDTQPNIGDVVKQRLYEESSRRDVVKGAFAAALGISGILFLRRTANAGGGGPDSSSAPAEPRAAALRQARIEAAAYPHYAEGLSREIINPHFLNEPHKKRMEFGPVDAKALAERRVNDYGDLARKPYAIATAFRIDDGKVVRGEVYTNYNADQTTKDTTFKFDLRRYPTRDRSLQPLVTLIERGKNGDYLASAHFQEAAGLLLHLPDNMVWEDVKTDVLSSTTISRQTGKGILPSERRLIVTVYSDRKVIAELLEPPQPVGQLSPM